MSGHLVPYHLRTNKYVERRLFLDILDFVRVWNDPTDYFYVSFGAKFLEDFRYINDRLSIERMRSLEKLEPIQKRQEFNLPYGFIQPDHAASLDFISDFDRVADGNADFRFIVWLDFAEANARYAQLQEWEQLLAKLHCGDVAKITLNTNFRSVRARKDGENTNDYHTLLLEAYKNHFGEYRPTGELGRTDFTDKKFASYSARAIRVASLKATEHSNLSPVPLVACRYSDGQHQMLTLTVVIADDKLKQKIVDDRRFDSWGFAPPDREDEWAFVHKIEVPDLSCKERFWINERLSTMTEKEIHDKMPFSLADEPAESLRQLKSYVQHYRRYPTFVTVNGI